MLVRTGSRAGGEAILETTVFRYRQKAFLKVLLLAGFLLVPQVFAAPQLYRSIPFWLALLVPQLLLHGYFASRQLIVSESGLETRFLGMRMQYVPWQSIVEMNVITPSGSGGGVGRGGVLEAMEPFAAVKWAARRGQGTSIRVVVTGWEPLVFMVNDIKDGEELGTLLRSKIPVR